MADDKDTNDKPQDNADSANKSAPKADSAKSDSAKSGIAKSAISKSDTEQSAPKQPETGQSAAKSIQSGNQSVDSRRSKKGPSSEKKQTTQAANSTKATDSPSQLFNAAPLPKMHAKPNRTSKLIPAMIGLLLIAAIVISAWTLYQQQRFSENWQQMQSQVETKLQQQTSSITQIQNATQATLQSIAQNQNQLNQLNRANQQLSESLLSTQEKIKALSGRQKQDWMLAEASYLIKIAQLQLTLQKDKATAVQLLKTADSRLIEIADNSLLPIRQAIAKDLSELSLIMQPDRVGLSYSLDAISKQVPQLEIAAFQFEPLEKQHSESLVEEQSEGFEFKQIYDKFLKDFVVIKDHSDPIKPLMSADQRANLNSNIQLALQQAQIAIAQGEEELYRLHIENATLWMSEFFVQNESTTQLIEQLNQLKNQPIKVSYPKSLHAKQALDEISQQQVYRWLETSLQNNSVKRSPIDDSDLIPSNSESQTEQQGGDQ